MTRVSNLSHLSSNPYTHSTGELSRTPAPPRQPLDSPGLSETAACVQWPHSAGARASTEILAHRNRRPIMKSFEYMHKLFVHKNNQCYQTCWLCNDFRIARGNLGSHPILRLWTRWSPLESRISQLPLCELWEVWEQTLNTLARQLFRRSVAGGRGQVVSVVSRAGSWAGTGPAGSEVRRSAVQSWVRGPLVLISPGIADTSNERRATSYGRLRRRGGRLGQKDVFHKSKKCHMTQQTDLVHSFRII